MNKEQEKWISEGSVFLNYSRKEIIEFFLTAFQVHPVNVRIEKVEEKYKLYIGNQFIAKDTEVGIYHGLLFTAVVAMEDEGIQTTIDRLYDYLDDPWEGLSELLRQLWDGVKEKMPSVT